jgi:hypothetical protein
MDRSNATLRTAKVTALLVYSLLVALAAWKPPLLPAFLVSLHEGATAVLASVGIEGGHTLFMGDPSDSIIPRRLCPNLVGQTEDRRELLYRCPDPLVRTIGDTLHDTLVRIGISSWNGVRKGKQPESPVFALMAWACFSPQVEGTPWEHVFFILDVEEMDFVTGERSSISYTSMSFDCTALSVAPPPWPDPVSLRPRST